jgi:UDP-4-amino-4,6-dideoxy-N-acetyl-beta-L-altrosamine transaminase
VSSEFIPYSRQDVSEEDIAAVVATLRSDFLTQGDIGPAFERAFADRHAVPHAIAVSNATAALHIACLALGAGVGTRVWTSPNSFLASANCALYTGATIDFVDIDPVTRNMSIAALVAKLAQAEAAEQLPDIVIPVDFAGLPCDLAEIAALAERYRFKIVEDASHATGATYQGRPVGSTYADFTIFSFHAVKIVTSAEGGMLTTRDAVLARRAELLRSHGMTRELGELTHTSPGAWYYEQQMLGFNYRLTELQAALGLSQLGRIETMQVQRTALADRYDALLADLPVARPARCPDRQSSWHLYAIELQESDRRQEVFAGLRAAGIGVNVHYIPIHLQPYYRALGFEPGDFPAAEKYYSAAISLPLFPAMREDHQDRVVSTLAGLLA